MNKIKLQFIGTFIYYKKIDLDDMELNYFHVVANRLQIPFNEALLDPFFYHSLRLEKYQSYDDLKGETYGGLDVNSFHQIELFFNGAKKQKFTYSDLNPDSILFPLYSSETTNVNFSNHDLIINWKEKGIISFKTESIDFVSESNLSFTILDCCGYKLIKDIIKDGVSLITVKRDTIYSI